MQSLNSLLSKILKIMDWKVNALFPFYLTFFYIKLCDQMYSIFWYLIKSMNIVFQMTMELKIYLSQNVKYKIDLFFGHWGEHSDPVVLRLAPGVSRVPRCGAGIKFMSVTCFTCCVIFLWFALLNDFQSLLCGDKCNVNEKGVITRASYVTHMAGSSKQSEDSLFRLLYNNASCY